MKRIAVFAAMLLSVALLVTGCDSSVQSGEYVMANSDGPITPYLIIKNDGSFRFDYFLTGGKYIGGKYDVNGETLTLTASGGEQKYVFEINGDILIFKKYRSSDINGIVDIPDSAEFVFDENEN
ncbi:MAG: lipocalin family protein [Clostridia bacterium]|nr:lipocalin family protein [Clostridia bacterium]